jgi:hypothetical protein
MFTFFATNTQNLSSVQVDNTRSSFLFLMLSMLFLSPLVAAQRGGGGFSCGFRGGFVGGYGYSGSGGECDNNCLAVLGVGGGIGGLLLLLCIAVTLCKKNSRETQIDNSLTLDCPYDNPQHWLSIAEVSIVNISNEYTDMIENLKLNPNMLNNLWEGMYTESGLSGRFNPHLIFGWNEEKSLMEFRSSEYEHDDYGDYRILNGMFSFENGRFVAHKEYFSPSRQTAPYTIVQAGNIEFVVKNEQICLAASGSWYSTYQNSVKGTFEYSKTIQDLTLADKCESYGTFANPFANS